GLRSRMRRLGDAKEAARVSNGSRQREPPRHKAVASRSKVRGPTVAASVSHHGTRPWHPRAARTSRQASKTGRPALALARELLRRPDEPAGVGEQGSGESRPGSCVEDVLAKQVPGNLLETGVGRGGACILMRAVLRSHGVQDRCVWVADSFAGLPAP